METRAREEADRIWGKSAAFEVSEHGLVFLLDGEPELAIPGTSDRVWETFLKWLAGTEL